jgi:hypothetical protein
MDLEIDTDPPSKLEIQKDIKSLKNKKAPGIDQLNAELFKIDPVLAADTLHPVFHKIWEKAVIPNSWSEGNIIRIPKSGDLTNCNNWRGITLLSIPSKVFCRVLISRITEAVDKKIRQEQVGFRKGRGCIDHIFVLRNILEQCHEWQRKLLVNFVDFEKAFDSLHRHSLWEILRNYGIPSKIVQLIKQFYANFSCTINSEADTNFLLKSEVRQGYVMSSVLCIIAIDWVMRTTLTEGNTGLRWTLCTTLEDTDYAGDLALLSHTEDHMQEKTRKLEENARIVGLKINAKKTKLIYLNTEKLPVIFVEGKQLDTVDSFNYLGSYTTEGGAERHLKVRIGKARSAFIRLGNIWKTTAFSKKTKLKLYNSCVLSVFLYGSE